MLHETLDDDSKSQIKQEETATNDPQKRNCKLDETDCQNTKNSQKESCARRSDRAKKLNYALLNGGDAESEKTRRKRKANQSTDNEQSAQTTENPSGLKR